jgi:hypothetical protein
MIPLLPIAVVFLISLAPGYGTGGMSIKGTTCIATNSKDSVASPTRRDLLRCSFSVEFRRVQTVDCDEATPYDYLALFEFGFIAMLSLPRPREKLNFDATTRLDHWQFVPEAPVGEMLKVPIGQSK